ncbi:MAG: cysteine hydrolase family protein [Candidatus Limiplasma sp.]|nr:cysteine hydrolase family protein [Candidatus Limiplasma sp.]
MQKPDALLVIDVQNGLIEAHPYQEAALIDTLQSLLRECRAHGVPVLYIQHTEVGEGLLEGSHDWQIAPATGPQAGEPVLQKTFSSAFRGTPLHQTLQSMGAKRLILCGMQTEYCVDTTCRVAFELGYEVTIAQGSTTTWDNGPFAAEELIRYYEQRIWDGRFAAVLPLAQVLDGIRGT